MSLEPGDILAGYCEGYFGRDSYGEKIVVAVGRDWVVARENGRPIFSDAGPDTLVKHRVTERTEWTG